MRIMLQMICILACLTNTSSLIFAEEIFVGEQHDYMTINSALSVAQDGDVITVHGGVYEETIETQSPGVTVRAADNEEVLVTRSDYVLRIKHERITIEDLSFDGQYSTRDGIQVRGESHGLLLRNIEVRNVSNDCIDLGSVRNVTIENSLIHHCLRSSQAECDQPECREDAHGIVGAAVHNLTVRNTEIHTFSGDAIQIDPDRTETGWSDLTIQGCRIWTGPLTHPVGGFSAGVVPGENVLDTKTSNRQEDPALITITDTHVWGFRNGLISNMAAFNLKENVRVHLDRVIVNNSEIAFRLRGRTDSRPRGAQVSMSNTLIYDVDIAVRYEDDIETINMRNITLGDQIGRFFQDRSYAGVIEGHNILVLANELPIQLSGRNNLAVNSDCFISLGSDNYKLTDECEAIDSGIALNTNSIDLAGVSRPQGQGWDIGAYELCIDDCNISQSDSGIVSIPAVEDMSVASELDMTVGNDMDNSYMLIVDMSSPLTKDAMLTAMQEDDERVSQSNERPSSIPSSEDSHSQSGCQQNSKSSSLHIFIFYFILFAVLGRYSKLATIRLELGNETLRDYRH